MATVDLVLGHSDKSLINAEEALAIFRETVGESHPHTALAIFGVGQAHFAKQEYVCAQQMFSAAFTIQRSILGESNEHTIDSKYWLERARAKCVEAAVVSPEVEAPAYEASQSSKNDRLRSSVLQVGTVPPDASSDHISASEIGPPAEEAPTYGEASKCSNNGCPLPYILPVGSVATNISSHRSSVSEPGPEPDEEKCDGAAALVSPSKEEPTSEAIQCSKNDYLLPSMPPTGPAAKASCSHPASDPAIQASVTPPISSDKNFEAGEGTDFDKTLFNEVTLGSKFESDSSNVELTNAKSWWRWSVQRAKQPIDPPGSEMTMAHFTRVRLSAHRDTRKYENGKPDTDSLRRSLVDKETLRNSNSPSATALAALSDREALRDILLLSLLVLLTAVLFVFGGRG